MYIPLQFWFCRNPGLALPLIALQYHEVRFNITFNTAVNLVADPAAAYLCPSLLDASLYIDYVYLDTEERRRFAQQSHEYLIEQLQYNEDQTITHSSSRIDLTLNHPVKELVWVFQSAVRTDCTVGKVAPFTYDDIVQKGRIQLNGQDRFDDRYGDYFWKVQPFQHHTGGNNLGMAIFNKTFGVTSPLLTDSTNTNQGIGLERGISAGGYTGFGTFAYNPINMYSFALKPEEHQPSGTCNFSRIDNATFVFDSVTNGTDDGTYPTKANPFHFRMYAVSYNILRIMSGMGGLAYSN